MVRVPAHVQLIINRDFSDLPGATPVCYGLA